MTSTEAVNLPINDTDDGGPLVNSKFLEQWTAVVSMNSSHANTYIYVKCDVFISKWYNRLHNDCRTKSGQKNKLRRYRIFKTQFEFELYLQCVNKPSYRHSLARFRCSSHKLHIEMGRYIGLESSQRISPHCHLDVETEIRFLLDCPLYNDLRNIMLAYMYIIDHYKGFETLGREDMFKFLMDTPDEAIVICIAKYVF